MNEPRVTYVPPSPEQLKQFAHEVSVSLAQQGDQRYLAPAVVGGLSDYLCLLAQLTAKYLSDNSDELLDKRNA